MKDLYTFDLTRAQALQTYDEVRDAYASFFDAFRIPYLVAEADSGNMGGNLSHEYHFPTTKGEDCIISCSSCQYVANEELAQSRQILFPLDETGTIPIRESSWRDGNEREASAESASGGNYDPAVAAMSVDVATWTCITRDRRTLVVVHYPRTSAPREITRSRSRPENEINPYAVKAVVHQIDAGVEKPVEVWAKTFVPYRKDGEIAENHSQIARLFDYRVHKAAIEAPTGLGFLHPTLSERIKALSRGELPMLDISADPVTHKPLDLLKTRSDDPCPKCSIGRLKVQNAVELGHTFFLGTRYSKPLQVSVAVNSKLRSEEDGRGIGPESSQLKDSDLGESAEEKEQAALQMGCHGIGISRMIAAVADSLADSKGLNWPRVIAPFDVVVIPSRGLEDAAAQVYDRMIASSLGNAFSARPHHTAPEEGMIDAIIDDREKDLAWKLGDADLIGYPVIVVVGRTWRTERKCEVQCRRLEGLRTEVTLDKLTDLVLSLLKQL
ncbi:MAG: hypothetical protein M1830_008610 [Pleopsidium flavum]|nr:MAG: hypothetical protein M1830_008610 [Pleopsidium flavum]